VASAKTQSVRRKACSMAAYFLVDERSGTGQRMFRHVNRSPSRSQPGKQPPPQNTGKPLTAVRVPKDP
jgi:hypothetical protein